MVKSKLFSFFSCKDNVYLYGAGKFTKSVIALCQECDISINGVVVTDLKDNPRYVSGIAVIGLEDLDVAKIPCIDLVVAITGNLLKVKDTIASYDFKSVCFLPGSIYTSIRRYQAAISYKESSIDYHLDIENGYIEPNHSVICRNDSDRRLCRVEWGEIVGHTDFFVDECNVYELEKEYGPISMVPHEVISPSAIDMDVRKKEKIEPFAFTSHLDGSSAEKIYSSGFIPIQVGAELTQERKGCIADDLGDNISVRNRDYSECTALYWLWKNTSRQNYIGLNHYRRRLALDNQSVKFIKENNIDVVTAIPHFTYDSLKDYFLRFITGYDWELMKKYILEFDESYSECINVYEKSHFFFPCNIALFKRSRFDVYCEFAFEVTEKIYLYYKERGWIRNDRYMGYIFENLESLFVMKHKDTFKVAFSDVVWIR